MDKKFILKTILLNTLWVVWIILSVVLGYVIYREAFPEQPVVIIPFSLLFLVAGGAAVFFVNKFLKKRMSEKAETSDNVHMGVEAEVAAKVKAEVEVEVEVEVDAGVEAETETETETETKVAAAGTNLIPDEKAAKQEEGNKDSNSGNTEKL